MEKKEIKLNVSRLIWLLISAQCQLSTGKMGVLPKLKALLKFEKFKLYVYIYPYINIYIYPNNSSMLCIDNNNDFSRTRSHLNKIVDVQHHLKNRTNKQNPPNNQKIAQVCDCCGAGTIFLFLLASQSSGKKTS